MRVLRILDRTNPPNLTAIGLHAHQLSEDLQRYCVYSTILTTNDGKQREKRLEGENSKCTNIIRVGPYVTLLGNRIPPLFLLKVLRELKSRKYDFIHLHSHLFFTSLVGYLAGRLLRVPTVVTNHGLIQPGSSLFNKLQWIYVSTVGRSIFSHVDAIFCYNSYMKKELEYLKVPKNKIIIVVNGVNTLKFSPSQRRRNKNDKEILVGFVGRINRGKGIDIFLEVCKRFTKKSLPIKFIIAGSGPDETKVRSATKDLNNVGFIGTVNYDNMPDFISNLDILFFPSEREGTPRVILEAMASGVPILASNVSEMKNLVGKAGIVCRRKAEEFESQITRLAQDSRARRKMADVGRERVIRMFSWEKTVQNCRKHYFRILQSRNSKKSTH